MGATRKAEFIAALAKYLVEDQARKSIELQMGQESAKEWAHLRSLTPLSGYPSVEEAQEELEDFLGAKKGPGSQPVPLPENEFYCYLDPKTVEGNKITNADGRIFLVRESESWVLNHAHNCIEGGDMPCLCRHIGEHVFIISTR